MALLLGPEETSRMAGLMLPGALAGEDGGLAGGPTTLPCGGQEQGTSHAGGDTLHVPLPSSTHWLC